jgi:hypothetical protein
MQISGNLIRVQNSVNNPIKMGLIRISVKNRFGKSQGGVAFIKASLSYCWRFGGDH